MVAGSLGPRWVGFLSGGSSGETIVVFLVILIVFGAKRLPEVAQSLGKSLREFRKAARDVIEDEILSQAPPPRSTPSSLLRALSGQEEEGRRVDPPRGSDAAPVTAEHPSPNAPPEPGPPPPAD